MQLVFRFATDTVIRWGSQRSTKAKPFWPWKPSRVLCSSSTKVCCLRLFCASWSRRISATIFLSGPFLTNKNKFWNTSLSSRKPHWKSSQKETHTEQQVLVDCSTPRKTNLRYAARSFARPSKAQALRRIFYKAMLTIKEQPVRYLMWISIWVIGKTPATARKMWQEKLKTFCPPRIWLEAWKFSTDETERAIVFRVLFDWTKPAIQSMMNVKPWKVTITTDNQFQPAFQRVSHTGDSSQPGSHILDSH